MKTWLRRQKSSVAHLPMKREGSHVEFWCGAEGDDAELVLATASSRKCEACKHYARNSGRK